MKKTSSRDCVLKDNDIFYSCSGSFPTPGVEHVAATTSKYYVLGDDEEESSRGGNIEVKIQIQLNQRQRPLILCLLITWYYYHEISFLLLIQPVCSLLQLVVWE